MTSMNVEPIPNALTASSVIFSLALMSATAYGADTSIENIAGTACRTGVHQQPKGPFAVFGFCDDAEGTNIAVFYSELGDPRFEKWTLTRRFWQSDKWGADVQSIAWMPNRNFLVVGIPKHELLRGLLGLLGDVELPADAVPRQFGRSAAPPESLPAITLAARLPTAPPI